MKQKNNDILKDKWVVILCGGRGGRLNPITETIPKPLVEVYGKPILWYIFLVLYKYGFKHFIFPLGYKGKLIEKFITQKFGEYDCEVRFIETGESSPASHRIYKVAKLIPKHDDFFLVNGDTFFDFDIIKMYQLHKQKNALLTFSSVDIITDYGVIVEEKGKIIDFALEKKVDCLYLNSGLKPAKGYLNAGLVWLNKDALNLINLKKCKNFEQQLYPKIIKLKKAAHYQIKGHWFAIDTKKDLDIINSVAESQQKIGDIVKIAKKNLATRYSYRTRYFDSVSVLKEKILNKTIIPHQVEIQPGPLKGKSLCWLRCPYCYGQTSYDTGERLTPERYIDILKQIAKGGVNKLVFAGYTTDPLNYDHIEDLLQVALDNQQIFGFHTKALRVSERFVSQVTNSQIRPMSYFSVSVDSGTNETYNKVHGIPQSSAKLYDQMLKNINKIVKARKKTGAILDISATFLINNLNNSDKEALKSIKDLRSAGVDLIRFTFPQVPRGYERKNKDKNIPDRKEILSYMKRLRPIIENENSSRCQILIMDLDTDHNIYQLPRTLPCFARFIFPSIGFDGWLSHCSESAAPHFHKISIGNLNKHNFWDLFYNYDPKTLKKYWQKISKNMENLNCKCDRKEHVVNSRIKDSGIFNDLI